MANSANSRSRMGLLLLAGILAGAADSPLRLSARASATMATEPICMLAGLDPPGVTGGETTEWTVTGRGLARVERFLISGTGIEVVAIGPTSDESIRVRVRAGPVAAPGYRELRAVGPSGISNLLLFLVDHLPQSREVEPNDDPATANPLAMNSAVAGVIGPQDLDHFTFPARAGQRVTIEVEAWRLGSPIVPVATLFAPSGASLAQSRPLRDGGHDARLSFVAPDDGRFLVQVRDALYRGGATARYRLRIDEGPFATGLFPLGGPRGETINVSATGGNLGKPWGKAVTLPDEPGTIIDVGPIAGPGGSVLVPARLAVGAGAEVVESPNGPSPTRLAFGATANGRIDQPGEVDRYAVAVKAGETIRVEVQAAVLGSWLDSLVTLDDAQGNRIAEDDDRGNPGRPAGGLGAGTRDSRLEFPAQADGELVVAITDRFGDGGPEYAYRLSVGPPRPDIALTLRLGGRAPGSASQPGDSGALNLSPGTVVPLLFQIAAEGRPGPITVRAEGLPPGIAAEPVLIRLPRAVRGTGASDSTTVEGTLVLKVEPGARPALGWLRIVATARNADATMLNRRASATLLLNPMPPDDLRPPPTRVVTEFPVSILAPARH
jgi:hypothetical protein